MLPLRDTDRTQTCNPVSYTHLGDDDRNAVVSDLFAEHGLHLFAGSGQRHYDADVGGVDAQALSLIHI